MSANRRGFTLIEVLVAAVLAAVGIGGSMIAMGAISRAELHAEHIQNLTDLTLEKYQEVLATENLASGSVSGDFKDRNLPNLTWNADVRATGTSNLSSLTVSVTNTNDASQKYSVSGLIFQPPATTSATPVRPGQ